MGELIRADGIQKKHQLTAFAGVLIGIVLGSFAVSIVAYSKYQKLQASLASDHKATIGQYDQKLREAKVDFDKLSGSFPCQAISALASERVDSIARLQRKVDEFPQFKTEPFKAVYEQLSMELEQQGRSVQILRASLQGHTNAGDFGCRQTSSTDPGNPLWTEGRLSLYPDGWKVTKK